MVTVTTITDPMRHLKEAMAQHQSAIQRVAECYQAGVEKYGAVKWMAMVQDAYPAMPSAYWTNIQRVADGRLIPEAVALAVPRLDVVSKLPIAQQIKLVKDGLVVATGIDPSQKRIVYACELSADIIKQSITDDGAVRTLEEQRSYIASVRAKAAEAKRRAEAIKQRFPASAPDETETNVEFHVVGQRVVVHKTPLHLTEADLRKLLVALKA